MTASFALRARWVHPVDRPPLEGGVVTIAAGWIVAVGENTSGRPPRDLGDVALVPGLVNAHTHLEFSLLEQPLGERGMRFPDWIGRVVAWRNSLGTPDPRVFDNYQLRAIERGLDETRECGTAAVGDIATGPWPVEFAIARSDLHCTVFQELLGLRLKHVGRAAGRARLHCREFAGDHASLAAGLSPHAPYSVHPMLFASACEESVAQHKPLAMHLAESREELEFIRTHTGPFAPLLEELNAWERDALPKNLRPLDYLRRLATAHRALVIHGNYLAADEIEFAAANRERMTVVYCPRTHAYFSHEPYPLSEMLAAGVRVAVGTDSRASNPDLNLWSELWHIAQHHPSVPPEAILRLGTLAGAEALGLAHDYGSITPGKSAQLAVVPLQANQDLFQAGAIHPLTTHQPSLTSDSQPQSSDSC